jgi:hypothetical protein
MTQDKLLDVVKSTLAKQNGILFAHGPASYVHRISYKGRSIIKPNTTQKDEDERGYLPVEWWIMSITPAENDKKKDKEGLTQIRLQHGDTTTIVSLLDCLNVAEPEIMGTYRSKWPLTKILDIGGDYVTPRFPNRTDTPKDEVPPIPCHIHAGVTTRDENNTLVHQGKQFGKNEAYFFPPLDVPPYNRTTIRDATTRLGVKPNVTKEQALEALHHFAIDDSFYDLLNEYKVNPYDGWTIQPGLLHAPGPYITFEIQLPQDDYHMASWRLGEKIEDEKERKKMQQEIQLRGLANPEEFLENLVDWEQCVDPNFKENHYRPSQELESGDWGKRLRIFFDDFDGQGFEILPGKSMTHTFTKPFAALLWSGHGTVNGNEISATDELCREFLVVPNQQVLIENKSDLVMRIWTVFPLK